MVWNVWVWGVVTPIVVRGELTILKSLNQIVMTTMEEKQCYDSTIQKTEIMKKSSQGQSKRKNKEHINK